MSALDSFFGGATTNTNQSNSGSSTSLGSNTSLVQGNQTSSTTPNLPQWYSTFLSSLPGQFQGLASSLQQKSQQPLYGAPQQAAFQNTLAHSQAAQQQQLNSQLASQGALNSGRAAQMDTSLALGGQKQLADYLSAVPQLNAQNSLANTGQLTQLLSQMAGFTSPISAFGNTTTGANTQTGASTASNDVSQSGTSTGVGQTNPNIIGGLTSSALQAFLSAIFGGQ